MQWQGVTVNFQKFEEENIICQIVGISKGCDQNGDWVSNKNKSCHNGSMIIKSVLVKYEKYGTLSIYII